MKKVTINGKEYTFFSHGNEVEITSGISCFEIINSNGKTTGGNVKHYETVRESALEWFHSR